ncbi:hypothetical protein CNR22_17820 [Sphingobacteriaceae bacterium]|nr:hypothetical protein CNR22_17820 [Sphingobacteriaceae bacterium]
MNMKNQIKTSNCIDFDTLKEDKIDLTDFIKNYDQIGTERTLFANCIRYEASNGNLESLNDQPLVINASLIYQLFKKLPEDPCSVNVRALQIIFGLEGDTVQLFFRPIQLTRTSNPAVPANISYTNTTPDAQVYKFANGEISEISTEQLAIYTNEYIAKIWIQRYYASDFYTLNLDSTEWQADSLSVIFSFQEIFSFYEMIFPCETNPDYNKNIYIYNGVANYKNVIPHWRRKHTLFLALEDLDSDVKNNLILSAYNSAANLAHLCPPNCNPVYRIMKTYNCL